MVRKRKRYPLEFEVKGIGFVQFVVEGRKGPAGTVVLGCATRVGIIPDKPTLATWIENRSTYEKEVQQAIVVPGTTEEKHAIK